ncbi:Mss4-like protein [Fomitopsis betulina]|nr:Mss4-like protein [Fomitopsis betulina]
MDDTESTSQDDGESETEGGTLIGACFCGEVSYAFPADDVVRSAYCHCSQCQKLSGCPFIHTIHLPCPSVEFTYPSTDASTGRQTVVASQLHPKALPSALRVYNAPLKPHKSRLRCAKCGTCIASSNSRVGTTSIWGVHLARSSNGRILNWEKVKPTAHIFYGTRVLEISDDLGKWSGYEGTSERIGGI